MRTGCRCCWKSANETKIDDGTQHSSDAKRITSEGNLTSEIDANTALLNAIEAKIDATPGRH